MSFNHIKRFERSIFMNTDLKYLFVMAKILIQNLSQKRCRKIKLLK